MRRISGFGLKFWVPSFGFRMKDWGFGVGAEGLGLRAQGSRCKVQGKGLIGVWGSGFSGFTVQELGCSEIWCMVHASCLRVRNLGTKSLSEQRGIFKH